MAGVGVDGNGAPGIAPTPRPWSGPSVALPPSAPLHQLLLPSRWAERSASVVAALVNPLTAMRRPHAPSGGSPRPPKGKQPLKAGLPEDEDDRETFFDRLAASPRMVALNRRIDRIMQSQTVAILFDLMDVSVYVIGIYSSSVVVSKLWRGNMHVWWVQGRGGRGCQARMVVGMFVKL